MNESHPTIEQLVDYLHGELTPTDDAAIHAHLAECSSCAELRAEEARLTEILRAHAGAEERELPPSVVAGVRVAIAQRPAWQPLRAVLRPAFLLPIAAAFALLLYAGASFWNTNAHATKIDAAYYLDSHAAMAANAPFSDDAPLPMTLTSESDETH